MHKEWEVEQSKEGNDVRQVQKLGRGSLGCMKKSEESGVESRLVN